MLQGHNLAVQLGHSIVDPVPSLFTFKIEDSQLVELSGVTFSITWKTLNYAILDFSINMHGIFH